MLAEAGYSPTIDNEQEDWHNYGSGLKRSFEIIEKGKSLRNSLFGKSREESLRRLDDVLELEERMLVEGYLTEILSCDVHFPRKQDISMKFYDLRIARLKEYREANPNITDPEKEGRDVAYNLIKNCRFVIQGALNRDQLFLVSKEAKRDYLDFANLLSFAPEERPFLRIKHLIFRRLRKCR